MARHSGASVLGRRLRVGRCGPGTSLRTVPRRVTTITNDWPAGSARALSAGTKRDDVLDEVEGPDGTFQQHLGPFHHYLRTVATDPDGTVHETVQYGLYLPWFGIIFRWPMRRALRHPRTPGSPSPWWAPPDKLTARQTSALALLAAAAMSAAFANTLFTQTSTFAADGFHASDRMLGASGAIVRVGVVIALPFAYLADRMGRRRTIVLLAWLTPLFCALGALSPSFWVLTGSQTIARPLGLALSMLATVAAAEDMPRNSRAYALSLLAMASGMGAGVAVAALKLADFGDNGWRLVYLISLIWLPIAVSLGRHLDETRRFETVHRMSPPLNRRRLGMVALVALTSNLFIAPASYFQNNYLDKVRGYSAGGIALFTLAVGTPASLGLIIGGRMSDVIGRRKIIAICTPLSAACLVAAFFAAGSAMWFIALGGGFTAAMAYPAFAVYRSEMFPTGNRGMANGLINTTALLAGSLGILLVGVLRDHGSSYGSVMAFLGLGQLAAAWVAFRHYPETAHLELEQLNPEDPTIVS
ncbi:MAG: MFS transporter, partial [Actinobacteria bacterium]|nr:MFS transporter [Actinomycetota bacterium]